MYSEDTYACPLFCPPMHPHRSGSSEAGKGFWPTDCCMERCLSVAGFPLQPITSGSARRVAQPRHATHISGSVPRPAGMSIPGPAIGKSGRRRLFAFESHRNGNSSQGHDLSESFNHIIDPGQAKTVPHHCLIADDYRFPELAFEILGNLEGPQRTTADK